MNIPVRVDYYSDGYGTKRGACFDDPANCVYDVNMVGWYLDYYDPNNILDEAFYPPKNWQFGWWDNAQYRSDVDASRGETDPAARLQNLQDAERILVETDLAIAPLYFLGDMHLINTDIYPVFGAMQLPIWISGEQLIQTEMVCTI